MNKRKKEEARIVRIIGDVDDVAKLVTGKSLGQLGARLWSLFGETIAERHLAQFKEEAAQDDPYVILGVRSSAPDAVVKAAYKAWMRKVHADAGGSDEMAKIYNDALDRISALRGRKL